VTAPATAYVSGLPSNRRGGQFTAISWLTYNTALGLMALLAAGPPPITNRSSAKARRFLVRGPNGFWKTNELDSSVRRRIGYGTSYDHSDMSNT